MNLPAAVINAQMFSLFHRRPTWVYRVGNNLLVMFWPQEESELIASFDAHGNSTQHQPRSTP